MPGSPGHPVGRACPMLAQLMIFPELGHLLFWHDPDGFADVAISFLLAMGVKGHQQH